ncbi:MAG: hypothetical protein VX740_02200 [Pseudomonadota bacterium]|jgi:hypothetical protein|nr:hypothetical protein [Pseudomonadota bacterium]MEC9236307.1 hypothetical protein [Pseudomonadota bacterium]MED5422230.1 hypothetical protein [Pseudomonadota bacterium]MEE3322472.1 hypothetical protein [Pseudomonadota bacterium]
MDVTKLLATVPILKTLNNGQSAEKSSPASPSSKPSASVVSDSVDVSAALGAENSLSAGDAETLAQDVGAYLAENSEASIGADANKLSQL